jgi:hypothetical protein
MGHGPALLPMGANGRCRSMREHFMTPPRIGLSKNTALEIVKWNRASSAES